MVEIKVTGCIKQGPLAPFGSFGEIQICLKSVSTMSTRASFLKRNVNGGFEGTLFSINQTMFSGVSRERLYKTKSPSYVFFLKKRKEKNLKINKFVPKTEKKNTYHL